MKSTRSRKIIIGCVIGFCIALFAVVGISYYILTKFSHRPAVSEEIQKKIARQQAVLLQEKNGKAISMKTSDGLSISALYFNRPQAKRALIIAHGWWMCKESVRAMVDYFPEDIIMLFDFRAHGQSDGSVSSIGHHEQEEVEIVFNFLREHHPDLPIYGIGISMGASALLAAANKVAFAGLVLESAFRRLDQAIEERFTYYTGLPTFPFMHICKFLYYCCHGISMASINNIERIKNIYTPIYIIHSQEDTLAPHHIADELYECVQHAHKNLWKVDKGLHATLFKKYGEQFSKKVKAFFKAAESPGLLP